MQDNGRPSLDLLVVFKMMFIAYFYGIRSERELERQNDNNAARAVLWNLRSYVPLFLFSFDKSTCLHSKAGSKALLTAACQYMKKTTVTGGRILRDSCGKTGDPRPRSVGFTRRHGRSSARAQKKFAEKHGVSLQAELIGIFYFLQMSFFEMVGIF